MSLVNDVLRQLDSASPAPQKSLPLYPMESDSSVRKKQSIKVVFFILVAFLLSIIMLQIFYKESILNIFSSVNGQEEKYQTLETASIQNEFEEDKRLVEKKQQQEPTLGKEQEQEKNQEQKKEEKAVVKTDSIALNTNHKQALNSNQIDIETPKILRKSKSEKKEEKIKEKVKEKEFQPAKIKTVENPGFKEYQLALRSYKGRQNKTALSWIDEAIAKENKDEYLRLKVRILSQLGNAEELRQFVLNNNDNTRLEWFALVAPSLQMYSYYELSNTYYAELVRQQPNEAKWRLAMALNYSKLGSSEKTYSIYKNLLDSTLLTNKQKKWIVSRIERMEQGKGVRNDS